MLDTWYFCCSVQAAPVVSAAYLSAIDTMRSRYVAPDLVAAAIEELARAESVLRHYALSDVMAAALRVPRSGEPSLTPEVFAAARRFLDGGLTSLDAEIRQRVLEAFDAVQADDDPDRFLVPFQRALRRSQELRRSVPPEPTPYAHLEEHLSETVLLALDGM
jgi:hypothetical protein